MTIKECIQTGSKLMRQHIGRGKFWIIVSGPYTINRCKISGEEYKIPSEKTFKNIQNLSDGKSLRYINDYGKIRIAYFRPLNKSDIDYINSEIDQNSYHVTGPYNYANKYIYEKRSDGTLIRWLKYFIANLDEKNKPDISSL